jgi:hypothetical protein
MGLSDLGNAHVLDHKGNKYIYMLLLKKKFQTKRNWLIFILFFG